MAIDTLRLISQPFTEEELNDATPEQVLQRMLSTASYISTTSSLAKKYQRANEPSAIRLFDELGKGQCGTVYGFVGSSTAVKLANYEEKYKELGEDYSAYIKIHEAIQECDPDHEISARLPKVYDFIGPKSEFWNEYSLLFDPQVKVRGYGLTLERIFPAPFPVREALVDALLPPIIKRNKAKFLAKPENKNCLIRLYLGRRHTTKVQGKVQNLKLQNFPLHVNEMEDLGLDTERFARLMANTLAIIHWGAGIDGDDIEFVLGSSPVQNKTPTSKELETLKLWEMAEACDRKFTQRTMEMWVFDLNECSPVTNDEAGIEQLVRAFNNNDPYYPQPGQSNENDRKLWSVFRKTYLDMSHRFTESMNPGRFIKTLEEEPSKENSKNKRIDSLAFFE
ncbi:zinc finger protein-domain-containing protein, partial [Fusarium venenatum]|uniref:zinc finger protein-domain-containing protein n=1 Tax=Fusarium venenatum TaxID=56646 RepID=UPI001D2BF2C3